MADHGRTCVNGADRRGVARALIARRDERGAALSRLAWLSIAAALGTIGLKTLAWALTGWVGFLSDAAESVVNLAAAIMALVILQWVARPPDAEHMYGHEKRCFSAGVEGTLICVAAVGIGWLAVRRLLDPVPLRCTSAPASRSPFAAAGLNLAVAPYLIRAGRQHRSLTSRPTAGI